MPLIPIPTCKWIFILRNYSFKYLTSNGLKLHNLKISLSRSLFIFMSQNFKMLSVKKQKCKSVQNDKKDNMLISKTEPDVTTCNSKSCGGNSSSSSGSSKGKRKNRRRRKSEKNRHKESISSNQVNVSADTSPGCELQILNPNFNCYGSFINTGFLQAVGYSNFALPFSQHAPQFQNRQTPANSKLHNTLKEVYMFRGETSSKMDMSTKSFDNSTISGNCNRMAQNGMSLSKIRNWHLTNLGKRLESANQEPPGLIFTIMNYNVLSQALLTKHQYLYSKHDQNALQWEKRWENLLCEITHHDADILCLQEVEAIHIEKYFNNLKKFGYESIYKRRASDMEDGCAIYYKPSVFNLTEYTTVEFYQNNISVLDRNNVAIVARFAPRNDPENEFVVATTHLLYNPRRQDVRLAQTQVLLTEVDRMAYMHGRKQPGSSNHLPIIVTGDFNSEPHSAVVELITRGRVNYAALQNRTLSRMMITSPAGPYLIDPSLRITDNCQHADLLPHRTANAKLPREQEGHVISLKHTERPVKQRLFNHGNQSQHEFASGILTHDLNLKSVYNWTVGNDTLGSTFQDSWITVDYIFYSNNMVRVGYRNRHKLQLVSKYNLPTTRQLAKVKYIPNLEVGSDHLSLLAKFKLDYSPKKSKI